MGFKHRKSSIYKTSHTRRCKKVNGVDFPPFDTGES